MPVQIVFVADTTFSNLINVNVGQNVDLEVPRVRRPLGLAQQASRHPAGSPPAVGQCRPACRDVGGLSLLPAASIAQSFWSRLAGTYGNKFSVKENGEADSIINTVRGLPGRVSPLTGGLRSGQ